VSELHFDTVMVITVMVIAMGLGLFSPLFGLGPATYAMTGTEVRNVAGPMLKYLSAAARICCC
jgi:hypothetical protein